MKHIIRSFIFAIAALVIAGCASVQVADYAQDKPKFDLREYLTAASSRTASCRIAPAKSFAE